MSSSEKGDFGVKLKLNVLGDSQQWGLHWTLRDDVVGTFSVTVGIPWLLTLSLMLNFIPGWFVKWCTRGDGEIVNYGLSLDHYEVKLQWGKIIDLPGKAGGHEWRHVWEEVEDERESSSTMVSTEVFAFALPATEKAPFQHLRVNLITNVERVRFRAWYKPGFSYQWHSTLPVAVKAKNAQGEDTAMPVGLSVRMTRNQAIDAYIRRAYETLGFDATHL